MGCQAAGGRCIVCAANAGVLRRTEVGGPCCVGEKYPLNLIWIMPAQGSVRISRSALSPHLSRHSDNFRLVSCLAGLTTMLWSAHRRYRHERQSEVPFRHRHVDEAAIAPLPNSRKIYVTGSRPDIRVPMREITPVRHARQLRRRKESADLRLRHVGPLHRSGRQDRHPLRPARTAPAAGSKSAATPKRWPASRATTAASAPPTRPPPNCASGPAPHAAPRDRRQERLADALRAPGHHHAGNGIHRDSRKPAPRRISGKPEDERPERREARRHDGPPASGPVVRRARSPNGSGDHAGIRARGSRARPRHHPGQHQSSGKRADDHRPQLPREDQRQHRQFGGHVVDRRGSRQDDLGDPLGRRHGDGSVDRQAHPRNARMDHPQFARCRSARCRSIRRWKRSTARPKT